MAPGLLDSLWILGDHCPQVWETVKIFTQQNLARKSYQTHSSEKRPHADVISQNHK